MFKFRITPSNNTQGPNTEATPPVFRFGTAKLQVQQESITTTGEKMLSQDQEASKEEEVIKTYPLKKKVIRREKKVISQYDPRQRELEEAQSRRNKIE